MREVYKALQRPEQVRRSAFDFVAKHIPSRRYLAVHWRFEGSLMEGGKTQSICKTKTNVRCQKIMNLYASPDLIVRKIRKQLALWNLNVSFESYSSDQMIFKDVYIASPPAEGGFLSILKEKFSFYGINVFIGVDLSRDLEDCYRLDSQVFSSIEQEICSKSTGFLYSPGSSWSLNTAIGKLMAKGTPGTTGRRQLTPNFRTKCTK